MRVVHFDYETRSKADLKAVGAYRYAVDESTEILMCGVSEDGSDEVLLWINPAFGESPDNEKAEALLASADILVAHAAPFEIAITWGANQRRAASPLTLPPLDRFRCTAAVARKAGLPHSLEKAAEALSLSEKKDAAGKALIRFFSLPNSKGTFNAPQDHPEKWAKFCDYCRQDVRTEKAIHAKLKPFELQGSALATFQFDLRMNHRGVPVNVAALKNAQRIIDDVESKVTREFVELTGLNPTQRDAVRFMLDMPNMTGDTVDAAILTETDPKKLRILKLYSKLSYAAVKKVSTMLDWTCPDGRMRGVMKYYGASTGRWCLTGDHEVLTYDGWVRLDQWTGGKIAVWNRNSEISFQESKAVSFDYTGDMYHHWSHRIDQIATPDHKMGGWHERTGAFEVRPVGALRTNFQIPYTGVRDKPAALHPDELRLLVAVQADGSYVEGGSIRFHFKKPRKIDRLLRLFRRLGQVFCRQANSDKTTTFVIPSRHVPLYLQMFRDKTFGPWLLDADAAVFFEELEHWDGCRCGPQSLQYSTTNETNANWIQALAHTSGLTAIKIVKRGKRLPQWSTYHIVNVWLNPVGRHKITCKPSVIPYSGKVYCAETSTGFFLVRRNGTAWITGNSAGGPQIQNAKKPTPEMRPVTELAYRSVQDGIDADGIDLLYGEPFEVLSSMIRHFIHAPTDLLDGDYNAVEPRILNWVSGQDDALEEYRKGVDRYRIMASAIYNIDPSAVTSDQREVGKRAILGLGYGMGTPKFRSSSREQYGIDLSEDLAERAKVAFRTKHDKVVRYWYYLDEMARKAIGAPGIKAGPFIVRTIAGIPYLLFTLRSGRSLAYPHPKIEMPEGEDRDQITYWGQIPMSARWGRIKLYGAKLVENETQATAADLMAHGAIVAEKRGMAPFALIHDQGLSERFSGKTADDYAEALADLPSWARGLPIRVEAKVTPFYRK
jgi:hypothetical protein